MLSVQAPYRVVSPGWWGFRGTNPRYGATYDHIVGVEADRVYPLRTTPGNLQVLSYATYSCNGLRTVTISTTTPHHRAPGLRRRHVALEMCAAGAVSTVDPAASDRRFVQQVTRKVLDVFAEGPAGTTHPAHGNVARFHLPAADTGPSEPERGDPVKSASRPRSPDAVAGRAGADPETASSELAIACLTGLVFPHRRTRPLGTDRR